jgi:hypothetical protein
MYKSNDASRVSFRRHLVNNAREAKTAGKFAPSAKAFPRTLVMLQVAAISLNTAWAACQAGFVAATALPLSQ